MRRFARHLPIILAVFALIATTSGRVTAAPDGFLEARIQRWLDGRNQGGGVQVLDPLLEQRIATLRERSPHFDRAWNVIAAGPVPVLIGTDEQIRPVLPPEWQDAAWAGLTVSTDHRRRLDRAAVAIRVQWLRNLHEQFGNPPHAFLAALDELLIHEVYGHLVPVLRHGTARYRCADPQAKQRMEYSCVGRRMAEVLHELPPTPHPSEPPYGDRRSEGMRGKP